MHLLPLHREVAVSLEELEVLPVTLDANPDAVATGNGGTHLAYTDNLPNGSGVGGSDFSEDGMTSLPTLRTIS